MLPEVEKEVENLIEEFSLNCSVEEFKDIVKWHSISKFQQLSENFIREFKSLVSWTIISEY